MSARTQLPSWTRPLLESGALDETQLADVAHEASEAGEALDARLVSAGLVPEETVATCRALEAGVPYVDPRAFDVELSNRDLIPEDVARKHQVFPLFVTGSLLTLGMRRPHDLAVVDQVRLRSGLQVDSVLCPPSVLESLIDRAFAGELAPSAAIDDDEAARDAELAGNKVVRTVHSLVERAARAGASDIHIEPERDLSRVRVRVDGVLHELSTHPRDMHAPIVSRIKVESKLDIAETRKPQDGHFSMQLPQGNVDVRVSTIPTVHGENVVLRLLLSGEEVVQLDDLLIPDAALEHLKSSLDHPHGMILVTGPTGSGKTTTLYAALARLNTVERNVVTVEDPVEKRVPMLRQTAVNPKAGVTFATGLRSILRQDPDVIMIGEIRDQETAEISVQAALTGHLLLSTLHTNTAAGAIVRLTEMGVPAFMITSSLQMVLSQRLVRRLCEACKERAPVNARLAQALGWEAGSEETLFAPVGCARCLHTGFKGRLGVYEMLGITPGLSRALLRDDSRDAIEAEAQDALISNLREDGLAKVRAGLTTLEEVARVAGARVASPGADGHAAS